jgi:ASCH domain-containing protein
MPKYISEQVRQRVIEIAEQHGFAVQLKDNGQDQYVKVIMLYSLTLNQTLYIRKDRGVKEGGIPSYFHIAVHPEFYEQAWVSASEGIESLINARKGNSLHSSCYYQAFPVYPENNEPCGKCFKVSDYEALGLLFKRMAGGEEYPFLSTPATVKSIEKTNLVEPVEKEERLQETAFPVKQSMSLDQVPTKGLIIKSPFIDRILAGSKTWEMRSSATQVRGPIALIKKGSGQVVGVANLVDVKGPLTKQEKLSAIDKHQISLDRLESGETEKWNTAWVLENAQPLIMPVNYQHPNGAVIWVTLEPQVQEKLALAMQ